MTYHIHVPAILVEAQLDLKQHEKGKQNSDVNNDDTTAIAT